jgi:dolichol-phosphate mannosyltransferase
VSTAASGLSVAQTAAADGQALDLTLLVLTRNEEENVRLLVPSLREIVESLRVRYEIVIVDASSDATADVARQLGCVVVAQERPGYGAAFRQGLGAARGAYVLTIDADHSHPPQFLRQMWACRDQADIVIASRYVPGGRAQMSLSRTILSRLLNWTFARLLALSLSDLSSGYRLYRRAILGPLLPLHGKDFDILEEILVKAWCAGYRIQEVAFEYRPRHAGRSNAQALKFAVSYLGTLGALWALRNGPGTCDHEARAFSSWLPLRRLRHRRRFAIVSGVLHAAGRTLSIDCGSSLVVSSRPATVVLDANLAKLRFLKRTNPHLLCGAARALPFRDAAFSAVVCATSIEPAPKALVLLSELRRVLDVGGTLLLHAHRAAGGDVQDELTGLLQQAGFEIMAQQRVLGREAIVRACAAAAASAPRR